MSPLSVTGVSDLVKFKQPKVKREIDLPLEIHGKFPKVLQIEGNSFGNTVCCLIQKFSTAFLF